MLNNPLHTNSTSAANSQPMQCQWESAHIEHKIDTEYGKKWNKEIDFF